ncbi:MAG: hypothetical protein QOI20_3280 [Acidimicrobiaceae bacterium]|jgi:hypothetical protein|nr:hypothetical protein [Acidimicrobiaceae bacterium]
MTRQSQRIAIDLAAQLDHVRKEIVLERTAEIVAATPVDTTWARSNWVPYVGEPPTAPNGSPDDVGAAASAQQSAIAAVIANRDPEAELGLANNAPYIQQLNEGSSPQAEAEFVEHAIERADERVKQRWMAKKIEL